MSSYSDSSHDEWVQEIFHYERRSPPKENHSASPKRKGGRRSEGLQGLIDRNEQSMKNRRENMTKTYERTEVNEVICVPNLGIKELDLPKPMVQPPDYESPVKCSSARVTELYETGRRSFKTEKESEAFSYHPPLSSKSAELAEERQRIVIDYIIGKANGSVSETQYARMLRKFAISDSNLQQEIQGITGLNAGNLKEFIHSVVSDDADSVSDPLMMRLRPLVTAAIANMKFPISPRQRN